VAFAGVIHRHLGYIDTKNLKGVTVIEAADVETFRKNLKKCSDLVEAHDPSRARDGAVPPGRHSDGHQNPRRLGGINQDKAECTDPDGMRKAESALPLVPIPTTAQRSGLSQRCRAEIGFAAGPRLAAKSVLGLSPTA